MNHDTDKAPLAAMTPEAIGKAARFAIACGVIGLSYLSIRGSLAIPRFARIFQDMLGENEPLPTLSVFAIRAYPVIVAVSFAVPISAVALLFTRNIVRSLHGLGILTLFSVVQGIVLTHALFSPLVAIIEKMQSSQ